MRLARMPSRRQTARDERLRAELERMRPVFEAAKAWRREISKPGAYGRVGDTRLALEESIDAAAAKETK